MTSFNLPTEELSNLRKLLQRHPISREAMRAQALLLLSEGESVEDVAEDLGVSERSVYRWLARFGARTDKPLLERVADGPRSGRPRTLSGVIDPVIDALIDRNPREFGYHYSTWTAGLFQFHLKAHHGIEASTKSIRRSIERLQIRWKRPRHRLALRPAAWKQAKGGSNADFSSGNALSS